MKEGQILILSSETDLKILKYFRLRRFGIIFILQSEESKDHFTVSKSCCMLLFLFH